MAYQISWLLEGRVILAEISGEFTLEETRSFGQTLHEYLDAAQAPLVHLISDNLHLEKFPMSLGAVNQALPADLRHHPRIGWTVIISSNRVVGFLASMLAQLSRSRFRTFATWGESIAFLNEMDSTLPDLAPLHNAARSK